MQFDTCWVTQDTKTPYRCLFASRTYEEMIDILYKENYINKNTKMLTKESGIITVYTAFKEQWLKTIKNFSSKKFNQILLTNVHLYQIEIRSEKN